MKTKKELRYRRQCLGAGMVVTLQVNPIEVSFERIEVREREVPATNVQGYFTKFPAEGLKHRPTRDWTILLGGNTIRDTAELVGPDPVDTGWSDGVYEWQIPVKWRVQGSRNEGDLPTASQVARVEARSRTVTITKFGELVARSAPRAVETTEQQRRCRDEYSRRPN